MIHQSLYSREMNAEHVNGNDYSPLPQSVSNTDTEDDEDEHQDKVLFNKPRHRVQRESDETVIMVTSPRIEQFRPLDETQYANNNSRIEQRSLGYQNDNISTIVMDESHDFWKQQGMSPTRRICLIISILFCLVTTFLFLYVLPCEDSLAVCSTSMTPKSSLFWEKTFQGIELQGPISVVLAVSPSLIFLIRGQKFGKRDFKPGEVKIPPDGGGILSVGGTTGTLLWWIPKETIFMEIDCHSFLIRDSQRPNCLVINQDGFLENVDPITGLRNWKSKIQTYPWLPIVLPDYGNDLLSVSDIRKSRKNLVLLSRTDGSLLANYSLPNCQNIRLRSVNSNFSIEYSCRSSNDEETVKSLALSKLLPKVQISNQPHNPIIKTSTVNKSYRGNNTWDLSSVHRLYVDNRGKCPGEECEVTVIISIQSKNETRAIWNQSISGAFVSIPTFLIKEDKLLNMEGCVLKFWHWPVSSSTERQTRNKNERQILTERVLMIILNNLELRVINASQSEILQICREDDCQPNLESKRESIKIMDLDNDRASELISYQSSYDLENTDILMSKIQVVKLDAVLETRDVETIIPLDL